jgi:type IV pilus modification protein PilV
MRRGITLLEVLVAAILLAVGLLGALEVVARCAATSREAEDRARGLMFARSKMDEILKEPVLQTGSDQGKGVDETTDYDWEAAIEESSNPSLVMVTVLVTNRKSGTRVPPLTVLRRPDLQTPPETAAGTDTDLDLGGGDL